MTFYKIWVVLEQYDEETGESLELDLPVGYVAEVDNMEDGIDLALEVHTEAAKFVKSRDTIRMPAAQKEQEE